MKSKNKTGDKIIIVLIIISSIFALYFLSDVIIEMTYDESTSYTETEETVEETASEETINQPMEEENPDESENSPEYDDAIYLYQQYIEFYYNKYGEDTKVYFVELNYDDIPEMIIYYTEDMDGISPYGRVFWYDDGDLDFSDTFRQGGLYYSEDGDGIYCVFGRQGYQEITQLTMDVYGKELFIDEVDPDTLQNNIGDDYYENDSPVEGYDAYDILYGNSEY